MKKLGNILIHTFLVLVAIIQIYPLFWLFEFSLKDNNEIFGGNIAGLPQNWRFENYKTAFFNANVIQYLGNSVLVTVVTIVVTLIFAATAAYAIQRMIWKGSQMVMKTILIGMMVPIHAVLLPLFLVLSKIHLLAT